MSPLVRFATTAEDLEAAFALRRAVFEVEQGVPRPLDRDAFDDRASHVVAYDASGRCIGTGRLVRITRRTGQIGREAVPAEHRRSGIGAALLDALERMAILQGLRELTVHAQLPAEPFYRKRGYVAEGEPFVDQGVAHVLMRKVLVP
ncbi:GNAT family N-acetyltransferase [Anaeromyxobacter oryzae]|uniref:GNAT family acetyltransferase n=1 Tax=Anaeromyxobacter oryzae TaxID=2918170 RepID=A0ABN6N3Z4_9BACT|nr:GNAT family N-acetyltransferase [Anaeromyxobacter oryzae]BDG06712.1 GNAT family acetyltransferase [Anaeromyxobacter oryzae]